MRSLKIFLKTVAATVCCLIFFLSAYLGVIKVYEAMHTRLFSDERAAVIIGEDYIKFFDIELYF